MTDDFLAARTKVLLQKPYFGTALWALKFVEVPGFAEKYKAAGHIAVDDHWRLYYDPEIVSEWKLEHKMAVLLHEIGHLVRRHSKRAEMHGISQVNFMAWNLAADAELNDDLDKDSTVELPEGAITPDFLGLPEGLLAEEYYDQMPKKDIVVNCGSGAHGVPQPWEEKESEGRAKVEPQQAELISRATAEAINESKSCGGVPQGWKRWAENYASPKVDWRKETASVIRRFAGDVRGLVDYTYIVPSRRQAAYGDVIMPSMVKPEPRIAIVADTSGSMGQDNLEMARSEIKGILAAIGNRTAKYYSVDAAVHERRTIRSARDVEFSGGGVTDMGVGIQAAMEDKPKPDIIIVITDGYTPWPDRPAAKVIACIVNESQEGPAYAKTINIPPKEGSPRW